MAKTKYHITLSDEERSFLTKVICEGAESDRTIMRAKILLMSDSSQPEKMSMRKLADRLGTTDTTIQTVRTEYATEGLEAALYRKTRVVTSVNRRINENVAEKILELASTTPPNGRKRWSSRMLCKAAVEQGIVDHISVTRMCEILKDAGHL